MEEVNYITILDGFLERSRNELLTSNNIDQDAVFSIINAEIQRIYSIDSEVYQDFSYNILPHFYIVENSYKNGIFQDIKRRVSINHNINNNFFIVFKEHLKEITILLSYNGSNSFRKKLRLTMLDIFKKTFNLATFNASNQEKELLFQFLVGGFIAILDYWSENPELTTNELFSFYISAVSNGIVNFVKEKMI